MLLAFLLLIAKLCCVLFQIEGFDVKHVDEYHLTGIEMDIFVGWEHRPPSTEGRGEGRGEGRKAKPEQKKPEVKNRHVAGKVSSPGEEGFSPKSRALQTAHYG